MLGQDILQIGVQRRPFLALQKSRVVAAFFLSEPRSEPVSKTAGLKEGLPQCAHAGELGSFPVCKPQHTVRKAQDIRKGTRADRRAKPVDLG